MSKPSKAALLHALFAVANPPPPPPVLQAIIDEAGKFLSQAKRNLYQLGLVYLKLQAVSPPAIFDKYGGTAASFWVTFVPQDDVTLRTVQRWSRIAGQWTWDVAKPFGGDALELLLEYCSKKNIDPGTDPAPIVVSFTPPKGEPVEKPFSQCTKQEMELAVGRGDESEEPALNPDDIKAIKNLKKVIRAAAVKDGTWIKFGSANEYGNPVLKLKLPLDTLPLLVVTLRDWAADWTSKPLRRRR